MSVIFKFMRTCAVPFVMFGALFMLDQISQRLLAQSSLGGWYWMCKQALCWALAFTGLGLVFGRYVKPLYALATIVLVFVGIAERYCMCSFHVNFAGDWILLAQATAPSELLAFWMNNWLTIVLSLMLIFLLMIACIAAIWFWKAPKVAFMNIVMGCLLVLPVIVQDGAFRHPQNLGCGVMTFQMLSDTFKNITMFRDMANVCRNPSFPSGMSRDERFERLPLFVMVIGESATRNHWGLYGYCRDTTPRLNAIKDELIVFDDVVGVWNQTPMAIRYLFTMADYENKNNAQFTLAQALKKIGYDISFISRQPHWGQMDNMISYVFDACDRKRYLMDERKGEQLYDKDLLPYFDVALSNSNAIVLHTYGSHYPYMPFCPEDEKCFGSVGTRTVVDDYDNATRHTDRVLAEVVEKVRAKHVPAIVLYVSDHGETPNAAGWRTQTDNDLWEIPLFAWLSPEYRSDHKKLVTALQNCRHRPLQADQILPMFLSLAGVRGSTTDDKNPMMPEFLERKDRHVRNFSFIYERK